MPILSDKEELDKLTSPEQLDKLTEIAPARLWLVVAGGFLILAAVAVWSFVGSVVHVTPVNGIYMGNGCAVCFADIATAKKLRTGERAKIYLSTANNHQPDLAKVTEIDSFVTSPQKALELLEDESLVAMFLNRTPVCYIKCRLDDDVPDKFPFLKGTPLKALIFTGSENPVSVAFPNVR